MPLASMVASGQEPTFRYMSRKLHNIVVLGVGDTLAMGIALAVAGYIRHQVKGGSMIPEWAWALVVAWPACGLLVGLLPGWGLSTVEAFRRTVLLWLGVFAMVSTGVFLSQSADQISRLSLGVAFLLGLPLVLYFRLLSKRLLIHLSRWGLPVVVYGGAETGQMAIRALQSEKGLGYVPVGIFEDDAQPKDGKIEGVPLLGGIEDSTSAAPAAILATSDLSRYPILDLLDGPLSGYRHVVLIPNLQEVPSLWVNTRDLGGMLGLEVSHNLLDPLARLSKRTFDLGTVLLTAPAWLTVCGLLALLIWLEDRGHPLFVQERVGRDDKPFRTFKFRTMLPDAEKVLRDRLDEDEGLRAEWDRNFKLVNDPRITRMGRFLRRTSLDELPQLFNVLDGTMSLVGPRPLPAYHADELPPPVRAVRSRVRPGITGLWQVSGRSEAGTEGMIMFDPYYVRNWSLWLDLVILFRTLRAVWERRGAY